MSSTFHTVSGHDTYSVDTTDDVDFFPVFCSLSNVDLADVDNWLKVFKKTATMADVCFHRLRTLLFKCVVDGANYVVVEKHFHQRALKVRPFRLTLIVEPGCG